ncbi:MAG: response regulator [Planctomycetales bacterium]|nr:response regulator [Planctomycetales bacterium]MCA9166507.1 response regulator [Planctomycetales bacterium]
MTPPKVLVVDDSRTVRTIVHRTLTNVGYEVITASDGLESLEVVQRDLPQLAILDIRMPYLDGYGVCQELQRLGEPYSKIPIIFLTTLESHALELLGDELGAYLQKPVRPQQLLDTVARFVTPPEPVSVNDI